MEPLPARLRVRRDYSGVSSSGPEDQARVSPAPLIVAGRHLLLLFFCCGSSILVTGSVVGREGSARLPEYAATKGAIQSLTRTLAQDLLEKGIRVNRVAPGPVWTPLNPSDQGVTAEQVATFGKGPDRRPCSARRNGRKFRPATSFWPVTPMRAS